MYKILEEITQNSPVGVDYRYEDEYLTLEAEMDKTLSPTTANEINWSLIIQSAQSILIKQSKDLKVLSYWLYAQWKQNRWGGLSRALPLFIKFVDKFQDDMYPKSTKVKLKTLEWLENTFAIQLIENYTPADKKDLEHVIAAFKEVSECIEKILQQKGTFLPLVRKLEKKLQEKPIVTTNTPKGEGKKEEAKIEVPSYTTPTYLKNIKNNIKLNAKELDAESILELLQTLGFLELNVLLQKNTELPIEIIPPSELRDKLKKMLQTTQKEQFLEEAIAILLLYPMWIEGYFWIIQALSKSNKKIKNNILKYKLINYIKNNYEKITKFSPKPHPILSNEIKNWLEEENSKATKSDHSAHYNREYQYALKLLEEKKKEESIVHLDTLYANSKNEKESFLWRLKQVELSIVIGNRQLAIALLYDLDDRIEIYQINRWEPELAIAVYTLFLKPIIAKELSLEKKENIYMKLCKISPKEALSNSFL